MSIIQLQLPRCKYFFYLVCLLTLASDFPVLGQAPSSSLSDVLDPVFEHPGVRASFWGVYVQNVRTGEVLYERNADLSFMPASVQKVLTTATALDVYSHAYQYQTTLYRNGTMIGDTLVGDLIIRGSGDPTFGSEEMRDDPFDTWAQRLKEMGIMHIRGRIIGDDNVFSDDRYPAGWDVQQIATQQYAVPSGGLSYRDNKLTVLMQAGSKSGDRVQVTMDPVPYFGLRNQASTSGRNRHNSLHLERAFDERTLSLTGRLSRRYKRRTNIPIDNPTRFTLESFAAHLQRSGIALEVDLVDIDDLDRSPRYRSSDVIDTHRSPPLGSIIKQINKESNNFYAEQIFRTFAHGGTAAGGAQKVRGLLHKAGASVAGVSVRDGSGLSRKSLVTPQALGQLLAYMYTHPEQAAFTASLPRGGESGSTLRGRLGGVPVHAKTGTLESVRSLAGYVTTKDDDTLAFVVIANHFTASSRHIRAAMDQMVQTLAAYRAKEL